MPREKVDWARWERRRGKKREKRTLGLFFSLSFSSQVGNLRNLSIVRQSTIATISFFLFFPFRFSFIFWSADVKCESFSSHHFDYKRQKALSYAFLTRLLLSIALLFLSTERKEWKAREINCVTYLIMARKKERKPNTSLVSSRLALPFSKIRFKNKHKWVNTPRWENED